MAREEGARTRNDAIGITSIGIGSTPLTTAEGAVEEQGNGFLHKTVISLTDCPVSVGNTTGISFGSKQLYDFPEARIMIVGGRCDLTVDASGDAGIAATGSGDISLGTTATADSTLGGTDVDIMASTALVDPFVASVGGAQGNLVKVTEFEGSTTAKELHLNIIIDDADVSDGHDGEVTVSGEVVVYWFNYGDHAAIG